MNSFIAPRFKIFVAEVGFLGEAGFGADVEVGGKARVILLLITCYWLVLLACGLLTKPARDRNKPLLVRGGGYGHALHVIVHGRSGAGTLRNAESLIVQDFFKRGQELQHVALLA